MGRKAGIFEPLQSGVDGSRVAITRGGGYIYGAYRGSMPWDAVLTNRRVGELIQRFQRRQINDALAPGSLGVPRQPWADGFHTFGVKTEID